MVEQYKIETAKIRKIENGKTFQFFLKYSKCDKGLQNKILIHLRVLSLDILHWLYNARLMC